MKKDLDLVMRITEVTVAYKTDVEVTGEKARERKCLALQADKNRQQQIMGLQWQKGDMLSLSLSLAPVETLREDFPQIITVHMITGQIHVRIRMIPIGNQEI